MESLRRGLAAESDGLSEAQSMEFAFAALLCGNPPTSLQFLERITNETHLLKVVPMLLESFRSLSTGIVDDIPSLRRLAVRLGGLKQLCLLVKCAPSNYFGDTADGECFADRLWRVAAEYNLLDTVPQPYLTGKMLMDLGVAPGKQMGEIIKKSFELQLDGKIAGEADAVAWAKMNLLG
jgi:tRNA nucleotidyltransferase (CCA-adding enzyme)